MALVKYNNQSIADITETGLTSGAMTLISTTTASADSSLSITSGIDDTYPIYLFKFINLHPGTDQKNLQIGFRDGSTAYDATKTTTFFMANHSEADAYAAVTYDTTLDLAQSTAYQSLTENTGSDNDQSCSGELWLFNPASTTFVKHFIAHVHSCRHADAPESYRTSGYCNVTAAIDAVDFKFSSGNIDSGSIKLFGLKDS